MWDPEPVNTGSSHKINKPIRNKELEPQKWIRVILIFSSDFYSLFRIRILILNVREDSEKEGFNQFAGLGQSLTPNHR